MFFSKWGSGEENYVGSKPPPYNKFYDVPLGRFTNRPLLQTITARFRKHQGAPLPVVFYKRKFVYFRELRGSLIQNIIKSIVGRWLAAAVKSFLFHPISKKPKTFSTFFKKGIDKPLRLWYNTCVIQRQQVPVKAKAFLPRR